MTPKPTIAVLEDDGWRTEQMKRDARQSLASYDFVFFDDAPRMISWLATNLDQTKLISLDCDLDSTAAHVSGGVGSGSDVADYLAGNPSSCPIIIHSSNAMRAPAMHMALSLAGWTSVKLTPFTGAKSWLTDVLEALG